MKLKITFRIILVLGSSWLLLFSCQTSNKKPKFGDPLITADIRYLKANGELSGTWSFFQRDQIDSLVPDARLHEFIINGQKISSDKVKNNYHMYLVSDTLISQNLNVQIRPSNNVISISMPMIPTIDPEPLQIGSDWVFTWDSSHYSTGDSISLVLSDSTKQTVLSNVAAQSGQLIISSERTQYLTSGPGFFYLISKANRMKKVSGVRFTYDIEVYSEDFPVNIALATEEDNG